MKVTIHPATFLSCCMVFCALWLWLQPVQSPLVPASTPRAARPERASITLDSAILERYVGHYEGRADFTVDISLKDGGLWAQSPGIVPFEMLATSETEFFLELSPDIGVKFRLDGRGAVIGFDAVTPYGPASLNRAR